MLYELLILHLKYYHNKLFFSDVGRTSSYQLVFTSSDIDYPIVEHCEEHCPSHGIIHTTIDSDDDEEAGSRSPLLNCQEDWKKICAEVKGVFKVDSDVEVAFIEENKSKEGIVRVII